MFTPRAACLRYVHRGLAVLAVLAIGVGARPLPAQPLAAPAGCTGPAGKLWLRVVVEGLRNAHGLVAITLYPDVPSRFLVHNGSLYVGRTKAVAPTTDSCIFIPKPGVYVIAIYHDENGNQKFDRTRLGLPAEAYGFSNNPNTLFGLPSFDSVRLEVPRSGLTAHIHLNYP